MEGKIIAPGLIEIHCHPAAGFSRLGAPAAANFESLRLFIVEPAKTDILCFLNLSNTGLVTLPQICCDQNRPSFVVKKILFPCTKHIFTTFFHKHPIKI
jgi:hypothetical protein